MGQTYDILNIQDDHPTILFGPRVEESSENEEVPPFYISLKVHDMILHNAMLDSGASHNLMPKVVMDQLGLEVTRPYKDLFSFDSRKVKIKMPWHDQRHDGFFSTNPSKEYGDGCSGR